MEGSDSGVRIYLSWVRYGTSRSATEDSLLVTQSDSMTHNAAIIAGNLSLPLLIDIIIIVCIDNNLYYPHALLC